MPRLRQGIGTEVSQSPAPETPTVETTMPASSAVSASLVDRSFKTTAVDDQLVAKAAWLPRIEPPAREAVTFRRLEQLEGVVLSIDVDEGTFRARLVDPRGEQPDQEAEIELEQVAYGDQSLLRPGALFFWTVGYRTRGRRRELALAIEFRRFPKVSRSTLEGETDRAVAAYLESAGWTE